MQLAKLTRNGQPIYVNPRHVVSVSGNQGTGLAVVDLIDSHAFAADQTIDEAARLIQEAASANPIAAQFSQMMAEARRAIHDPPPELNTRPVAFECACDDPTCEAEPCLIPAGMILRVDPCPRDAECSILRLKDSRVLRVKGKAVDVRTNIDAALL